MSEIFADSSPLATHNRELTDVLAKISRAVGGDPGRPDWAPEDALAHVEAFVEQSGVEDLRMEVVEKRAILRALKATNGCRRAAARALGISKTTIYRKLRQYDIESAGPPRGRPRTCGE